jgi:alkanesulfonate monooxygenase SsuD/methylene tetrahydromethanopterin reductase-like flavin-dependent oxidoreductase (luciferase family)
MKFSFFIINQSPAGKSMKSVYDESLQQIEWGERLGYEAVFLAEHVCTDHGKPSPHVILGNIAARTSRLRIGTAVSVLPWHNPLEIAQDYATVDLLSDGRLNFGVGRGTAKHEFDTYNIPWEESEARFEESLAVILKAWTGQPFSHKGRFFQIPEVVLKPAPLQKPRPPIWQPCLSPGTIVKCLERGIQPIVGASLTPLPELKKKFDQLTALMKEKGHPDIYRVAHPFVFVGDTEKKAQEEARGAMEWFIQEFAKRIFSVKEGEQWPEQYKFHATMGDFIRTLTFEKAVRDDLVWFGDAKYVSQRIRWLRDECNADYLLLFMSFGGLEHERVLKSMELFARKIMPEFA